MQEKLKRISVVRFFAISYIVIYVVSIAVNICVYASVHRKLLVRVNEYNESILKSRVENLDKLMSDISVNAVKLSLLKDIDKAITYTSDYTATQRLETLNSMNNIGYQLSEQVEKNIIYCHNSELILSANAVDNAQRYYNAYFAPYFNGYEQWKDYIDHAPSGALLRLSDQNGNGYAIIYIYQFNAIGRPDCKGTVITQLNNSLLFSDADMVEYLENSNGEIIAANVDDINIDKNDKNYIKFEFKSEYLDLNYVYLMPKKVFQSALRSIRSIVIVGNLMYAIIAGLIIWYFTNIHSNSIESIMETITKKADIKKHGNENEYELIDNTINLLLKKYEESASRSTMEKRILGNSLMAEFVKGEYYGITPIEEHFNNFGITFPEEAFYITTFYFDDLSELFFEEHNGDKYENYELSKFILQNVFEDIVPEHVHGVFFEINRVLMCVFNMSGNDGDLDGLLHRLNEILKKKFNIRFKAAVSNIHYHIDELPIAYHEVSRAAQNRYISKDDILKPVEKTADKHGYVYTVEKEQQIINYMRAGNAEGAKQLIRDILTDCYRYGEYSEAMVKCIISDIYATILRLLDTQGNISEVRKLIENVHYTGAYHLNELPAEIAEFIDNSVPYTEVKEVPKKNIAQRADELVLSEYRNPSINVNYIAERLGVSANYLSAKYKSIRGIALLDYINMIRIERAKDILEHSDEKLEEISKSVGFTSVRTFTRVFSNLMGTTPGAYREKSKSI